MENKNSLQKYFNKKYFNKSKNYNIIVSEIRREDKMNNNKLLKTVAASIITLIGATGVVFAGSKIYNEYIKKQDNMNSSSLISVENEKGYSDEFILANMKLEENSNLSNIYYKIITSTEELSIFKTKENNIPDMSKEEFNENILIVIFKSGLGQPHEMDLKISDVESDDKNTYITLEQNENPDYNKSSELIYAVIDKTIIKNNIKINLKERYISDLDKLPKNYNKEDAIKDGCFVVDEYKIISNNKNAIDDLISKAKEGKESTIRIYHKYNGYTYIMDLSYKNNIYTLNSISSEDNYKNINVMTGKYVEKRQSGENKKYYDYDIKDYNDKNYLGIPFLTVDFN